MRLRIWTIPLVAILALVSVPAGAIAQERTVAVTGSATQQVPNDTAGLGFSVVEDRKSRVAALRVVSARLRGIIAAVQGTPGVGQGDVTTGRISVRKVLRDKRTLYRASEGISVILHQPDRAGQLIGVAIAAGATGTSGPRFFPGNPELAYDNALIAAFDQARAKATALATRAGGVLGPAISIEEASEIVTVAPKEVSRGQSGPVAATPPTKPGASTVTATVHVVFALQ
jgi:uncharacterized protein YggE